MKIELKDVNKKIDKVNILSNININIDDNCICAFVGGNNSGKSLLLKIISGLYFSTSGKVLYDDIEISKLDKKKITIGFFNDNICFLPDLTGEENLLLLGSINCNVKKNDILDALKIVNIIEFKDKKYRTYSSSTKRKLALAQVFMDNPSVIILDNPFEGLDEMTKNSIIKKLKNIKGRDRIIIISLNSIKEAKQLTNKIYELKDGTIYKN